MRAGYLIAPGHIELRSVPDPEPGPGEVLVRVRAALTDGTDLKAYLRGHPQMPMPTPFGHEFSGDAMAMGPGVSRLRVGDAVMAVHSAPCGTCFWCRADQENLCRTVMETKVLGAYAERLLLPAHIVERNAFVKPAGLSYEAAAFLEPLACVVHAVELLGARAGDLALVLGAGGFGLLHVLLLRALDVRVAVIARNGSRLELAKRLGAQSVLELALDPRTTDEARAFARSLSQGRGADRVVECTGRVDGWVAALALARRGGSVSLFGGPPPGSTMALDTARIHYDQIGIVSPFHFRPRDVRRAYDLLAQGLDVEPLISGRLPLSSLPDAFTRLQRGDDVKLAVIP